MEFMGNFKKQMLFSILIALASSASHSNNTKKHSNDKNEVIILGTYQKLENIFKKNKINGSQNAVSQFIDKHGSGENSSQTPESPIDSTPITIQEPGIPENIPDPIPVIPIPMINVVKESGVVTAKKFIYGEFLSYNVSGNISSNDEIALWMTDSNTVVVNDNIVEANYTSLNNSLDQYSVHVDDHAEFANNGTIGGINTIGVYLSNNSTFENTLSGVINNVSNYGIMAVNNSSAVNEGLIQNTGNYGLAAYSSSLVENGVNGIVGNTGMIGMYTADNDSSVINRGVIENNGSYGIWVSQGTGENYGTIQNNGSYGMFVEENGRVENYGFIQNGGAYGMQAQSGGIAVNQTGGIIGNIGNHGMNVTALGTDLTTATNNGLIQNTGDNGMSSSGAYGIITNNETIENTGIRGMAVENKSTAVNKGIIGNNSSYGIWVSRGTGENYGTIQNNGSYGMFGEENGRVANYGIIQNSGAYGMQVKSGATAVNQTGGIIGNIGNHGMNVTAPGTTLTTATNNGLIQNTGDSGMSSSGAYGMITNNGTIENTGMHGMAADNESTAVNMGIIGNNSSYGIWVSQGTGRNHETIQNNGSYGMFGEENGRVDNYGIIQNSGAYGMQAQSGATAVNQAGGIIGNIGNYGMNVTAAGTIWTIATNNGLIQNTGDNGMSSSGAYGIITNNGTIENTGIRGMAAENESTAINEGIVRNNGMRGMSASSGSYIENKENGSIENIGNAGFFVSGNGSLAINRGTISNTGIYGIWAEKGSKAENYGTIQNNNVYGMISAENGRVENHGIIQNNGNNGLFAQTGGTAINHSDGIIRNVGNYGMFAVGDTNTAVVINYGLIENTIGYGMTGSNLNGIAINNGTVKNKGTIGMYGRKGIAVNNGLIEITGNSRRGSYAEDGGVVINNGSIIVHGLNAVGMFADRGSTIINQGTITIDGTGTGMSAANDSHIILGAGSVINIGALTRTHNGTETSADGFYIKIDATSDVNNQGALTSDTRLTIDGTGKFVLSSSTGSLQAVRLNLRSNLYMGAEKTLNSSEDQYIMNNINVDEITGEGSIVSNSPLFTAKIQATEDNEHVILMKRKSFTDVITNDLGTLLEENYKNSENNSQQNKVYNSLKGITDEKTLATAEKELTGDSIVNNQTYQLFNQDKIISNGIDKLMNKRSEDVNNGIYVNFLSSKTNAKTENEYSGYDGKSAGVVLGGMKKIGDSTSVGGFLGYLDTNANYTDNENSQNLKTWSVTGALNKELTDELVWKNRVNYNYGTNESEREITFDNSNRTVKVDFNSWSAGAGTELEYSKKINDIVTLRPTAGIAIDYLSQEGYTEKGADEFKLKSGLKKFNINKNRNRNKSRSNSV